MEVWICGATLLGADRMNRENKHRMKNEVTGESRNQLNAIALLMML
jgi:hypothetical protein